ncbi:hypothetical protein BLA29_003620 [Euroglyphus maynei]|uniref:No apical meristem-associated C-terminal domain-containing protein n=1 Tax=Euroglyphus maynei TaxID=6958 RepID=A0A1Y3AWG4_EURMA|nr:hypothetical protein BLA29_003620 [Euroglyphus maynei]
MDPMHFSSSSDDVFDMYRPYQTMQVSNLNLNNNLAHVVLSESSKAKKMTANPAVIKSNSDSPQSVKPSVNYRLIHHLYVHYKTTTGTNQCQSLWSAIAHDYNLVLFTNYSATEIESFWRRMPSMEKRKIDLQHYENYNDLNDENSKPSVLQLEVPKVIKKSKKSSTITNGNKKMKKSSAQPGKMDKSCQVNSTSSTQDNVLIDLAKEEHRLKIEILKIRLEYMQQQFKRMFPTGSHVE